MATKSEKSKCRLKFDDLSFILVASDNNKSFGVNCNCACRPVTWTQCRDGFHNGVCLFISTDIMATDRVNYVWPAYNPSYRCRHIIRVFQWECQNSSKGGQSDFYQTLICCRPWPRGFQLILTSQFPDIDCQSSKLYLGKLATVAISSATITSIWYRLIPKNYLSLPLSFSPSLLGS